MYNYLIYLNPDFKKDISELFEDLKKYFSNKKSTPTEFILVDQKIILRYKDYNFYIDENQEEYINEELQELSINSDGKDFAGENIELQKFSNSMKRFELSGEDDFDMDFFNESLFVIGFFEKESNYLIFEAN